ncbi:exodeoxyribonuclease V subunit alpha [Vibrio sp. D431a]|uniref:exodeoxyribonuclease V subunit alpha n=1 Tax=Vibrio sp. D431a TaxID=2837388 RepID=UPI002554CFAE|nr:exodeoxyribonuclease V subunit alpha [Vibrio sp. D431a]MDK9793295.1 exodeoxyribonuclease V subunit alpha [Vibrio sp. D431a]
MSKTIERLKNLKSEGVITEIDYHFASTLMQYDRDNELLTELTPFVSALLSTELSRGNTCVKIDKINLKRPFGLKEDDCVELLSNIPDRTLWGELLLSSSVCSESGQTPLIYNEGRLYLNKYWRYEKCISETLVQLASQSANINTSEMRAYLEELFPRPYSFLMKALSKANSDDDLIEAAIDVLDIAQPQSINWNDTLPVLQRAKSAEDLKKLSKLIPENSRLDWQKIAVASSLLKPLAIITGGPGTGKTTTVIKLLASMIHSHRTNANDELSYIPPTIKLVAPTGKAAMRLTESIGGALQTMNLDEDVAAHIPTQASTLHRLLGATKGASKFRFNAENRLHLDALVVDEASMIDLPMMFSLVCALPPHAKLILLGDKDQLASVEAGSVLADFCAFSRFSFSSNHTSQIEALTSFKINSSPKAKLLTDCVSELKKSYRFHAKSGIGQLAKAVNNGESADIDKVLSEGFDDVHFSELNANSYNEMITQVSASYAEYIDLIRTGASYKEIIDTYNSIRLLCAVREGEFGLTGLNSKIEKKLCSMGLLSIHKHNSWYEGRPIMVVRNDYSTGLYNGDIGITVRDPESNNLIVIFEFPDGSIKQYQTCRIPDHETAFAMTIHKSQGSEFPNTYMVLPVKPTPVLTRELVYTGITRAKTNLHMFATRDILHRGAKARTIRHGGLFPNLLKAIANIEIRKCEDPLS